MMLLVNSGFTECPLVPIWNLSPRCSLRFPIILLWVLWNWMPFRNSNCLDSSSLQISKHSILSSWNTVLFLSKKTSQLLPPKRDTSGLNWNSFSMGQPLCTLQINQIPPCHLSWAGDSHMPLLYHPSPSRTYDPKRAQTTFASLCWHLKQWGTSGSSPLEWGILRRSGFCW